MASTKTRVDIWLGHFESKSRFESYFKEQYDRDDSPINDFCRDMGATYYNHDCIEAEYFGRKRVAIDVAIADGSWSASYAEKALAAYRKRTDITKFNSTIFLFASPFKEPSDARGRGIVLYYLGRFPCRNVEA